MTSTSTPSLADRYLDLMEEILINSIYQDKAMDPWSPPVYDAAKRDTGRDWPQQAMTMIGGKRLRSLRECCETVLKQGVLGDFVETGIWRGGACIMMTAVLAAHGVTDRRVWGFDSFEGLPKPDDRYPSDRGDQLHSFRQLAISREDVIDNFRRVGLLSDQVRLVKGWFKDTLPGAAIERIAILRLDGDLYESTIQALEALYPKLENGGFCIIDDYGAMPQCPVAVQDYRRSNGITVPLIDIDQKGVLWKKT